MDVPLQQCRRRDHHGDDVLGRRGDAHPQDEAGDGGEHQGEEEGVVAGGQQLQVNEVLDGDQSVGHAVGQPQDRRGEFQPEAGQGRGPDNESHARAGRADGEGIFRSRFQGVQDVVEPHLAFLIEDADEDDGQVGPEGAEKGVRADGEEGRHETCRKKAEEPGGEVRFPVGPVKPNGRHDRPYAQRCGRMVEGVHVQKDAGGRQDDRDQLGCRPFVDLADGDGEDDPPEGCQEGAAPRDQDPEDDDEGADQKPLFPEDRFEFGEGFPGETVEAVFHRLEMDHAADGVEMEHRREDGAEGDFHIGYAEELRHDEGSGAHDRRHELAPRRGGRFDGPRELRPVTDLLHQGNGEGPDRHGIGDGAAADRAEEPAADDGDLRGDRRRTSRRGPWRCP